jgi:hypothetical protein
LLKKEYGSWVWRKGLLDPRRLKEQVARENGIIKSLIT